MTNYLENKKEFLMRQKIKRLQHSLDNKEFLMRQKIKRLQHSLDNKDMMIQGLTSQVIGLQALFEHYRDKVITLERGALFDRVYGVDVRERVN